LRDFFHTSGRRGFLKGFLVAAIFAGIVVAFLPVRYETNDDFGTVSKLSGWGGPCSDFLHPTLSSTLGRLLCSLYRFYPDFPWYGLFIYAGAFLAMYLTLSVLIRSTRGLSLFLALPLLCLLFLHVFVV